MKEEQKKKLRSLFNRLVLIAITLISAYVLYRSIFQINSSVMSLNIYNSAMKPSDLKPMLLIVGTIVYIVCLKQLYRLFSNAYFNEQRTIYFGIGITVVFFAALLVYSHYVTVNPTYDLSHIKRTIYASLTGNKELRNSYYYKRYPNNLALLMVVKVVMKIASLFGMENVSKVGNLLGSLSLTVTAFLCFLTAKKLRGNNMALLVAIIFATNPLFYLYSSYCYTDVLSMPFSMAAVYLFVCFVKSEQCKKDYLKLAGAGIAIGVGYKIRATVIILFAAMLVWTFTREKVKTTIKVVVILAIGMAPAFLGFKAMYAANIVSSDKNVQFPITHWLMMGLNEESYGKYNGKDFQRTSSYKTYEEKVAFNKEEIIRRIKSKGVSGLYAHSKEKLAIVWSDGYGIPSTFRNVESYNAVYDYSIGTKSIFLRYYAQICRCALFFLMLIHFVNLLRKKEAVVSVLEIALLGAFVFYLLWEANERYSVSFLPWILLLMIEGVRLVELASVKETIRGRKRVWKLYPTIRGYVVAGLIVAGSIFVMVSNQPVYTKQVSNYADSAFLLPRGKIKTRAVSIGKKEIKQEFSTDRAFNQITLLVENKKIKKKTSYEVSLYEDEKVIRSMIFTSNQVKRRNYLALKFDTVTPKEESVYTVRIRSEDATRRNTVKLVSSYHCDGIECKTFMLNGEKQDRNLAISVNNLEQRTYVSLFAYWGLCIMILGVELLAFGTVIIRRQIEKK